MSSDTDRPGDNNRPARKPSTKRRASPRDETHAKTLIRLAGECELWHDTKGVSWAAIKVDGHREHWPIRSKAFKRFLSARFFGVRGTAPSATAMQDALGVLEGRALFEGAEHTTHVRVAGDGERIYLDLCDPGWHAVEIDASGWRVVDNLPVRFRRAPGMLRLPVPVSGGQLDELREFINVTDEAWPLLVGWLLGTLHPKGPYPLLVFHGEQGSGKSTAAKMLRSLIDPNEASERSAPRDERDLVIAANNSWILSFGNLSTLQAWLSDALCRVASGGGFATRELYTDSDEVIFGGARPVVLNGIPQIATRGDLLDRSLLVELEPIPENKRLPESDLWRRFELAQPRILGALLDAVVVALANRNAPRPSRLPRMADFSEWVIRGEKKLGLAPGEFLRAYETNRRGAFSETVEASAVGPVLLRVLADRGERWSGTAKQLLEVLEAEASERERKQHGWPSSPRGGSGAIRRLAPSLRGMGYRVDFLRIGRGSLRTIVIEKVREEPSPSSPSSPKSEKPGKTPVSGDGWRRSGDGRETVGDDRPFSKNGLNPEENASGDGGDGRDGHLRPLSGNPAIEQASPQEWEL